MYRVEKHPLADRDPRFNIWQVWKICGQIMELVKETKTEQAARNYVKKHS